MTFWAFIFLIVLIGAVERRWAARQQIQALKGASDIHALALETKKVDAILKNDPDLFDLRN